MHQQQAFLSTKNKYQHSTQHIIHGAVFNLKRERNQKMQNYSSQQNFKLLMILLVFSVFSACRFPLFSVFD